MGSSGEPEICDGENGPRAPPGGDRGASVTGRLRRVAVLLKSPNVMEGVLDGATTHQRCERGSHAPPLSMKDDGVSLAGARDLLGNKVKGDMMNDKELQMLAKAENRLAAAKQDVHEAQTATSGIKRAQLEDLAQELTEEAQHHLEETKEVD